MEQMSETSELILIGVLGIISLFIPLTFILLFGPKRFEKREKH